MDRLHTIATAGYYLALRVGYAFALEEVNALPPAWIAHYAQGRLMPFDPTIRWAFTHDGWTGWEALTDDPRDVLGQAATFGLRHGITAAVWEPASMRALSFGSFARSDRPFTPGEAAQLQDYLLRRHRALDPPQTLTQAEIAALRGVKNGKRIKQIAHELGVTEGAVKQRLRNAKEKLSAHTSPQAATLAARYGLV